MPLARLQDIIKLRGNDDSDDDDSDDEDFLADYDRYSALEQQRYCNVGGPTRRDDEPIALAIVDILGSDSAAGEFCSVLHFVLC